MKLPPPPCRVLLVTEGSLEAKLPTIWTDGKAEVGRVRREKKREDQRGEKVRRKKMQLCEKVGNGCSGCSGHLTTIAACSEV